MNQLQLKEISAIVNQVLTLHKVFIDDMYKTNIVIVLVVALFYQNNKENNSPSMNLAYSLSRKQQSIIRDMIDHMEQAFLCSFSKKDKEFIQYALCGFLKVEEKNLEYEPLKNHILRCLQHVETLFHIDLHYISFIDSFTLHCHYMIIRCRNHTVFHSEIAQSVIHSQPYLFDVAYIIAKQLEKFYQISIPKDEIGLILIYLGNFSSYTPSYDALKVLCISPSYHEIEKRVSEQLSSMFHERIDLIGFENSFDYISNYTFDLIIALLPNHNQLAKTIEISTFITPIMERKIERFLSDFIRNKKRQYFKQYLLPLFDHKFLFYHTAFKNEKDILSDVYRQSQNYKLTSHCLDEIAERESLSNSCYHHRFSIPHVLLESSNTNNILLYYSETPISWFHNHVHLVLFIFHQSIEQSSIIYNYLIDILMDDEIYQQIIHASSIQDLQSI